MLPIFQPLLLWHKNCVERLFASCFPPISAFVFCRECASCKVTITPKIYASLFMLLLAPFKTIGGDYRIPVKGQGLEPPLTISQNVLNLVPAAVGDTVTVSILVANPSNTQTRQFHWDVPYPKLSRLTVAPTVATLAPGQQARVEVQFLGGEPPKSKVGWKCMSGRLRRSISHQQQKMKFSPFHD
jgi:hypothetical protein